jgi:hypothetical protein
MVSQHATTLAPIIRRLAVPLAARFSLRTGKITGNFENPTLLRDVTSSPLMAKVTKAIIGSFGVLSTFGCFLSIVFLAGEAKQLLLWLSQMTETPLDTRNGFQGLLSSATPLAVQQRCASHLRDHAQTESASRTRRSQFSRLMPCVAKIANANRSIPNATQAVCATPPPEVSIPQVSPKCP